RSMRSSRMSTKPNAPAKFSRSREGQLSLQQKMSRHRHRRRRPRRKHARRRCPGEEAEILVEVRLVVVAVQIACWIRLCTIALLAAREQRTIGMLEPHDPGIPLRRHAHARQEAPLERALVHAAAAYAI